MLEDGYTVGSEFFENFIGWVVRGGKRARTLVEDIPEKVIVHYAGKNNEGVALRSGF